MQSLVKYANLDAPNCQSWTSCTGMVAFVWCLAHLLVGEGLGGNLFDVHAVVPAGLAMAGGGCHGLPRPIEI